MKKSIVYILLITVMLFTACTATVKKDEESVNETSNNKPKTTIITTEPTTEPTNKNEEMAEYETKDGVGLLFSTYDELLAILDEGMHNGFYYDYLEELGVSSVFNYRSKDMGYRLIDIDNNGTEELVLGANGSEEYPSVIYDVYTMKDGKMLHVLNGWERNRFYLCENGMFANEGSSGAANSTWNYYRYNGKKIEFVEAIKLDSEFDDCLYYFNEDYYGMEGGVPLTNEEVKAIEDKYIKVNIEFTTFIDKNERPSRIVYDGEGNIISEE